MHRSDPSGTDTQSRDAHDATIVPDVSQILELARDAFLLVHDMEGAVVFASAGCADVMGYTPSEYAGMSPEQMVHPDDIERLYDDRRKQIEEDRLPTRLTFRSRHKDGHYVWIECLGSVVTSDEGIDTHVLTWNRNVSSAVASKTTLRQQEELYARIIESLDAIVWEADLETLNFTFVSQGAETLLGFPVSQWLDEPDFWTTRLHPNDRVWAIEQRKRSVIERRTHEMEYRLIGSDDELIWVRDIARFVNRENHNSGLVGVMIDVTRWKEAELAQRLYSDRLTVMNELHHAILTNPLSAAFIAEAAVQNLSRLIPICWASVAQFDPDMDEAVFLATWEPAAGGLGDLEQLPASILAAVIDTDVVETYHRDLRLVANPTDLTDGLLRAGVLSTFSVPLRVKDSVLGVVNMGCEETDGFSDEHKQIAREVARVLALSLQHTRLDLTARQTSERLSRSEDRWGRLVLGHYSPIVILVDGTIAYGNEAAANIFGLPSADACKGVRAIDLVAKKDIGRMTTAIQRLLAGENVHRLALSVIRADGEVRQVEAFGSPVIWEDSKAIQIVLSDVTERHSSEKALKASETLLSSISRNISDGIFRSTPEGKLVYVNEAFASLFKYDSTDEVLSLTSADLYAESDRREKLKNLVQEGGSIRGQEVEFKTKTGETFWGLTSSTAVRDDAGNIEYYDGAVSDITAFKHQQTELVQARDHAEELNRIKTAFLANMSHEIRTPLSSIIGFAGILAEQATDENREFAELIYISGQRLMETLNSVLDLAQLEGKTMKLSPENVDLGRQVDQSLLLFRNAAVQRGLDLRYEDHAGEPVRVDVDRAALSRVLNNLLGNANKFTTDGSITVRVHADTAYGYVSIADTGVGISEAFLPHVFDEFSQESSGLQRTFEGSGLGLTITKRLVELMGGSISVSSAKGKGSTFQLRFKRSIPARTTGSTARAAKEGSRSILVVEDNSEMRELLRHLLGTKFGVGLAANPGEARDEIKRRHFDVVLLDVNLGEETTGVDLLSELRDLSPGNHFAAIACTAYALPGDREKFLEAGFDEYIGKPFTTENLFEVLDRLTSPFPDT